MNRSLSRAQSLALGLVVLACLSASVWGLLRISGKAGLWADAFEFTVRTPDAQDVERGTPVYVRGFEAGQVVGLEYTDDGVLLHVRLAGQFRGKIYSDAIATIRSKGAFGGSVIAIHPGTSANGPLAEPVLHARPTADLADVTAKLSAVAGRVDAVLKEVQEGNGTLPKLLKDDAIYNDLKVASGETKTLIKNLNETVISLRSDAQKTLKGVDDSVVAVHLELEGMKDFVRTGKEAVTAIKQDAEAIKSMPLVRSYVDDPVSALIRPDCMKDRVVYQPEDLFEPGRSVLTSAGKEKLNEVAGWLNGQHQKNSDVVVVAFADPKSTDVSAAGARMLTKKQAETVTEYLRDHGVHKMGYVTRRKVTPIGQGFDPTPVVEKEKLPAARVEVILFVPQS